MKEAEARNRTIIRWSSYGVGLNLCLAAITLVVGLIIQSRAVVLEAAEGLSEFITALIAILAAVVAGREASKAHPMGFGRVEYISAILATFLILVLGVEAIRGSVRALRSPGETPEYDLAVVLLLLCTIAAKLVYGVRLKKIGTEVHSASLLLLAEQSSHGAYSSAAVLATIGVNRLFRLNIEPWLSILLSLLLIYNGVELLWSSAKKLLGTRADQELRRRVLQNIVMEPGVIQAYNLVLHNYGEGIYVGSVDIEVNGNMRASELTCLSRRIIRKGRKLGVTLSSVGVSGMNLSDSAAGEIWERILDLAKEHPEILRVHGFMADFEEKVISFNLIFNEAVQDTAPILERLRQEISGLYPELSLELSEDQDY